MTMNPENTPSGMDEHTEITAASPTENNQILSAGSFDPKGDAAISRIDEIFKQTSAGLQSMMDQSMNDLSGVMNQLADQPEEKISAQKKLASLRRQMKEQQELLSSMPDLKSEIPEDFLKQATKLVQDLSLDTDLASGSDIPAESENTGNSQETEDLFDFMSAVQSALNVLDPNTEAIIKSAAPKTESDTQESTDPDQNPKAEESTDSSESPKDNASSSWNFMDTINGILNDTASKAKDIEEEFSTEK